MGDKERCSGMGHRMRLILCVVAVLVPCVSLADEITMPVEFGYIFYQLWKDSAFGRTPFRTERAAWILFQPPGEYTMLPWPASASWNQEIWHGSIPASAVAQAHTHPEVSQPQPSDKDVALSKRIRVPIYTISSHGIWVVTPDGNVSKVHVDGWYSSSARAAHDHVHISQQDICD